MALAVLRLLNWAVPRFIAKAPAARCMALPVITMLAFLRSPPRPAAAAAEADAEAAAEADADADASAVAVAVAATPDLDALAA